MNDDNLARDIEQELEKVLKTNDTQIRPVPKTVPSQDTSLSGQWDLKEKIETELRNRIRREEHAIRAGYDAELVKIENEYAMQVSEMIADLETDKRNKLRKLVDDTAAKLREHDLLKHRMKLNS